MIAATVHAQSATRPCRNGCGRPAPATVMWHETRSADGFPVMEARKPLPTDCPACEAVHERGPQVTADPEASMLDWLDGLGVNTKKHGRATIENFDATHAPQAPVFAGRFVEDALAAGRHDRVDGLYFVGPPGTGKSHLGVAILREVHARRPAVSVAYVAVDRLVARVQDSYNSGATDQLIEALKRPHVLLLDDLGREKATPDALRILCTVLDEREGSATIITANYMPDQLVLRHRDTREWARVESRLGDRVYRFVPVDGPDRRFQDAVDAEMAPVHQT